jgi:hypothetical protein
MPVFARRFRRTAGFLALAAVVALVVLLVTAAVLVTGPDPGTSLVAFSVGAALIAGVVVLVVTSRRRSVALRQVSLANRDGVVFLARRQPALVSDLATYLGDQQIYDEVSDRWVVASIDARGMTAWSVGRDARELLLVPWDQIGSIDPARLESGRTGIAVDVKPFEDPLIVSVGYSAFGIMAAFGRRGVAEVIESANALRPADPPFE